MTNLVKSNVCQLAPQLNIAKIFFYLSKQKAKLHNLVTTMFLGFCFQMPQEDI